MDLCERLKSGDLGGAIRSALESVRSNASDPETRFLLAELLCFRGEFSKADSHLEVVSKQSPELGLSAVHRRQLIRAASIRQSCFGEGVVPEFLPPIDANARFQLKLWAEHRAGDGAAVSDLQNRLNRYCDELTGSCNGQRFRGFADLDDSTQSCLELLTATGRYFWIPWHRIESLDFEPVKRPRDLLWRSVRVRVRDGPESIAYIPVQCPLTSSAHGDAAVLGRETSWEERPTGVTVGIGQRILRVGDEDVPVLELSSLSFDELDQALTLHDESDDLGTTDDGDGGDRRR